MLILTRRVAEVLYVGNDITVTVLAIKGNQVRIGVKAPLSVSVDREELRERKRLSSPADHPRMPAPTVTAECTAPTSEI